jgi:hypothetical protein
LTISQFGGGKDCKKGQSGVELHGSIYKEVGCFELIKRTTNRSSNKKKKKKRIENRENKQAFIKKLNSQDPLYTSPPFFLNP